MHVYDALPHTQGGPAMIERIHVALRAIVRLLRRIPPLRPVLLRVFAVIGVFATLAAGLGAYGAWRFLHPAKAKYEPPESMALYLDFTQPIGEAIPGFRLSIPALIEGGGGETPLIMVLRALESAKSDPKVAAVVARFAPYEGPSLAQAQEIAPALDAVRAAGKPVYAYAASYGDFGPGRSLYVLASHCDNIWLQPIGAVALSPLAIEAPFGKTALSRLGIEAHFMQREEYKSVMENVARDAFSAPVRANMTAMLASLNGQVARMIAQGRKIDEAKAASLLQNGPYTASEALAGGLITKLAYEDEFLKELDDKIGKDTLLTEPAIYLAISHHERAQKKEEEKKGSIALIYADGMIADAPPDHPYDMAEAKIIDTDAIVQAFEDASEDEDVKAILVRVNSPGGSPVSSETIRRALLKAKESKKPVYVSMGDMAASGGYWIAMNGDRIFANPATLTGSIGVVAGKFVVGGLLDKLGVKMDRVGESAADTLWSMNRPFDARGRARMDAMLNETYKAFTENVAAARKIAPEKMPDIAKGRVFTGEQAVTIGLVDELGGMNDAVAALKKAVGLAVTDRMYLRPFPEPETPSAFIIHLLKSLHFTGASLGRAAGAWNRMGAALAPYLSALGPQSALQARIDPPYPQGIK